MCLIAISIDFLDIVLPNPFSALVADREGLAGWLSITDLSACLFWFPLIREGALDGASENLLRVIAGTDIFFTGADVTGSAFGADLAPRPIPGRALPAESGLSGILVLKLAGVSLGKCGRSSVLTGARRRGFGELGRDDGADEGAEIRPRLSTDRPLDVKLLLPEILPTEGERAMGGADERMTGWRVGVDDRELERVTEAALLEEELERHIAGIVPEDELGRLTAGAVLEDELEKLRGRDVGVEDLEFCADVAFTAVELGMELETDGRVLSGVDGQVLTGVAGRVLTGVDGRILTGVAGRVLTGVDDRATTGCEATTDGFDEGTVPILLLGVVGLELTEEMLPLSTDDLLLLDKGADWIEGRELHRAGLVETMECLFSVS